MTRSTNGPGHRGYRLRAGVPGARLLSTALGWLAAAGLGRFYGDFAVGGRGIEIAAGLAGV